MFFSFILIIYILLTILFAVFKEERPFLLIVFIVLSFASGMLFHQELTKELVIDPIEVYRGSTVLEITYRDGIPVDSVVVLKDNKQ